MIFGSIVAFIIVLNMLTDLIVSKHLIGIYAGRMLLKSQGMFVQLLMYFTRGNKRNVFINLNYYLILFCDATSTWLGQIHPSLPFLLHKLQVMTVLTYYQLKETHIVYLYIKRGQ